MIPTLPAKALDVHLILLVEERRISFQGPYSSLLFQDFLPFLCSREIPSKSSHSASSFLSRKTVSGGHLCFLKEVAHDFATHL